MDNDYYGYRKEYFDIQQVEYMINNEIIEFMSLEHVRGRTLKKLLFDF